MHLLNAIADTVQRHAALMRERRRRGPMLPLNSAVGFMTGRARSVPAGQRHP